MSSKAERIRFEVREGIGIISLNDPPANELALPEFIPAALFEEWTAGESLKGLIIRGERKNFSAGGNLEAIFDAAPDPEKLESLIRAGLNLLDRIQNLEIPVIAAINRVCFGGGLEIALACHIRVASENALLAFPEVNRNLIPGMGGIYRLHGALAGHARPATPSHARPHLVTGHAPSLLTILGGDTITASDALEMGIVDYIAPKDKAFDYALALMLKMTRDRPLSVIRSVMRALKNVSVLSPEEAIRQETLLFCSLAKDEAERRRKEEA
jgi:enoyl-CoA hydratase/carnithine racemase